MNPALDPSTAKLSRPSRPAHLGGAKFLSVARTHAGKVRALNEDRVLDRPDIGLWAVADGMGGHHDGGAASTMVIDALERVDAFSSAYAYRDQVSLVLQDVNAHLRRQASESPEHLSGSTVVAMLVHQNHFACLWAGDSRAYALRAGMIKRLTHDHSMVQAMVDSGALSADEARHHPRANVITRAVGAADSLLLESVHGQVHPGDRFLLCSDGLTTLLADREIAGYMARAPLQAGLDAMLGLALARGAPDNVTIVLISAEAA